MLLLCILNSFLLIDSLINTNLEDPSDSISDYVATIPAIFLIRSDLTNNVFYLYFVFVLQFPSILTSIIYYIELYPWGKSPMYSLLCTLVC